MVAGVSVKKEPLSNLRILPRISQRASAKLSAAMILILLALLSGALLPVQAAVNTQLRGALGHPIWAAFASFLVGALTLGLAALVLRLPFPALAAHPIPLWQWSGGVLGTLFVTMAVILAPRLGAATTFSLVIGGQLLMALTLDHFGWLGLKLHPLNAPRLLGGLLLVAGVLLMRKY